MHAHFGQSQELNPDDVLAALDRVCASRTFAASPRLTSFLRYVVEATLCGYGPRLKGYTVGVGALGRGKNFDPQIDAIVRVEAIRLRAALARYYADAGALDPVVIDMPRGHYQVQFHWRATRAGTQAQRLVRAIRAVRRFLNRRVTLQAPSDSF